MKTITRYGLGREYAGNTGSPAITEQADGAYVSHADHLALINELQAELVGVERIAAAQTVTIAELRANHSEIPNSSIGAQPTASAEPVVIPCGVLCFDGGSLHVQDSGSGHIVVPEGRFTLEDDRCEGPDGPQGSIHWLARIPASEMIALRNFLNAQQQRIVFPSHLRKMWSGGEVQAWLDAYFGCVAQQVSAKGSLERYRQWQAQQDAEKVNVQPVAYGIFYEGVMQAWAWTEDAAWSISKEDYDTLKTSILPLYTAPVAAQPDPALAGDEWLKELGATLDRCLPTPERNLILQHARKRVQPASGEDAGKAAAIHAAVAAVYFDDSSDYLTALWEVVRSLSQPMADLLESNTKKAFDQSIAAMQQGGQS